MRLNLPILDQLADSQRILIAGAGGGFDVFSGLPIYFTLREMGKTVHLANYSFMDFRLGAIAGKQETIIEEFLVGAQGSVKFPFPYYPEGYLSQWFKEKHGDDMTIWMFGKTGVIPLEMAYNTLVDRLDIDAVILVDGGVDSLMQGDEMGAGTMLEDTITLAAVENLKVKTKLLACIGFGTEVEEGVCHYHALANIAALTRLGAFLGTCSLTPQMPVFQEYESACRYVWEQPEHAKSHISTRILPAARGEFGNYRMYEDDRTEVCISPLMSMYWFFDAKAVAKRNLVAEGIRDTYTHMEAYHRCVTIRKAITNIRARRNFPY